jgi:hypothetical protein
MLRIKTFRLIVRLGLVSLGLMAGYTIVSLRIENADLRQQIAVLDKNVEVLKHLALPERRRRARLREMLRTRMPAAELDKAIPPEPAVWTCSKFDPDRWGAILK